MTDSPGVDYDVAIVGGRVAGASLALLLGQRDRRVLVIDRDRFPSDTLSTHYMASNAVALLAQLGVLPEVEAAGFRRITRARTYLGDCLVEGPLSPDGSYGLAPRRDALDAILIAHAVRRGGVTFLDRTRADGLIEEDGRVVGVRLTTAEGERRDVRARVVVGADGKYSKVAEWVGAARYHEVPALRPVYYGYYWGLAPLPEPALEMFYVEERIGFIFPMQPDRDCLALELQPEEFAAFRADPQAAFEERFRALPGMAFRLRDATLTGKVQGSRGIDNHFRQPHGPGWALTGDAGYLKDPNTGLGIGDALNQSLWLADALDAALGGADWDETLGAFQRKRDEALLPLYRATLGYAQQRDSPPEDLAWLQAVLCSPALARGFAAGLPAVALGAYPEPLRPRVASIAEAFGAPNAPPS